MKTLRFLLATAPKALLLTAMLSVMGGLFNGALVAIVHQALSGTLTLASVSLGVLFVLVGAGKLVTSYLSELSLVRSAQTALAELRLSLIRQLQHIPFRDFERLGTARLLTTLSDDVSTLSNTTYQLPSFVVNLAISMGGACYLAYLSWPLLLISVLFTLSGAGLYALTARRARASIDQARTERERLKGHFIAFTHGIKELKLHRGRRLALTQDVSAVASRLMALDVHAHSRFTLAHITTQVSLFGLIGFIVFVAPQALELNTEILSGYVLTALYLLGPMAGIATMVPTFNRASIALARVEALGVSLHQLAKETATSLAADTTRAAPQRIELRGVTCSYGTHQDSFLLGPIDLIIEPGELLFISGGNGSGKSTLAKVLVGLYQAGSGEQLYGAEPVTDNNRDNYRQNFSAVFADYYLFDSLRGLPETELEPRANSYLTRLQLSSKVKVSGNTLSTIELSQGQRKRLALLTAFLEDRPVYLFDEWAADQDPAFKDLFYRALLPELQKRQKTVIVISHDDRYFDVADRHVQLQDGKLISSQVYAAKN